MPVVKFTSDITWKPVRAKATPFKAGNQRMVTTAFAAEVVAKGKGEIVKKPRRKKSDD